MRRNRQKQMNRETRGQEEESKSVTEARKIQRLGFLILSPAVTES